MKNILYFRCSRPLPYEDAAINEIQERLFADMEEKIGFVRGQTDIDGLRIDFNCGLRLEVPPSPFYIRISHALSKCVFFQDTIQNTRLISREKYAIPWQIDIWQNKHHIFSHTFNPLGQNIIFHCSSLALGDTLAFLPYARLYRDKFGAKVYCWVDNYLKELIAHLYPDIPQVNSVADAYATYYLGTWKKGYCGAPVDGCIYPLTQMAGAITGIYEPAPSVITEISTPPPIKTPYICIGVQASTPRKGWFYPQGWEIITEHLKKLGYRVICIDRHTLTRADGYEITCPANAENLTGDHSLMDRAKLLAHAQCFIGLSSGLAWLAHYVGCPVIMISGMSASYYEFPNPYRVVNRTVCHDCFNDKTVDFMSGDACPFFHGTDREFECSKSITPDMVLNMTYQALKITPENHSL